MIYLEFKIIQIANTACGLIKTNEKKLILT